jgi:hypothetical protein
MVENFFLSSIVVAAFGVEWTFYSWEQPQIVALERSRQEQIKTSINEFLKANLSDVQTPRFTTCMQEFVNEFSKEKNKDLILPVGGYLSPHGKIFKWLLRAFIFSVVFGLFGVLCDPSIATHTHLTPSDTLSFYIKLALAVLTFGPLSMAAWLGWDEFQYVLRIKEMFKVLPPGEENALLGNRSSISRSGTTEPTRALLQASVNDAAFIEIERVAQARLKQCVDILKMTSNEPLALYQIRELQKSLNPEREQVSVVMNNHLLLHINPNTQNGPIAACWRDESSGGQSLYPAMKKEGSGIDRLHFSGPVHELVLRHG